MHPDMQAITGFLDILKIDMSKVDKAKMKSGTSLCLDAMKPATTLPGDIDDLGWDLLKNAVNGLIDRNGVAEDHVTVGDTPITATDVDKYLSTFSGVDAEVREKLRGKPKTLKLLKERFTAQEQAKLVGNPVLIALLTMFGPLIIDFIKHLLSK